MDKDNPQYGRVKGAPWFEQLYKKDILVLGQGGIGSWVTLALARIGVTLHTFDMDTYEAHNMTGQCVRSNDIGKNKAVSMQDIIKEFSPDCEVYTNGEYNSESTTNNIVICGFDNMNARKIAFENWEKGLTEQNRINSFFMDGRLNVEHFQIFSITGSRQDLIDDYKNKHLFSDDKIPDAECTFKQTTHSALMIAGHMVAFLTNWAFNQTKGGKSIRVIPFKFEYMTALNITTNNDRL